MGYSIAILNNIRDNASIEYQERIPAATQKNIAAIGQAFSTYTLLYNEFSSALLNKIGKTILEQKMFKNKLARFKGGAILTEQDVEEIFIEMASAEGAYDSAGSNPLGRRTPPNVSVIYHRMSRQDKYVVTVGDVDFVRVFRSEATLDTFMTGLINSIYSGDANDEFQCMKNVLATYGYTPTYAKTEDIAIVAGKIYYTRTGSSGSYVYAVVTDPDVSDIATYYEVTSYTTGYFDYEVPTLASSTTPNAFAKDFIKTLRKAVLDLTVDKSDQYNAAGVQTWEDSPTDLVLLVNKDVLVECDVEQLAQAFNVSDTDLKSVVGNIIPMADFGTLTDTYGLLIDKDFFRVYDTLSRMEPQRNADGLFTNYFYHHWQILSASTFKNAVRFVATTIGS